MYKNMDAFEIARAEIERLENQRKMLEPYSSLTQIVDQYAQIPGNELREMLAARQYETKRILGSLNPEYTITRELEQIEQSNERALRSLAGDLIAQRVGGSAIETVQDVIGAQSLVTVGGIATVGGIISQLSDQQDWFERLAREAALPGFADLQVSEFLDYYELDFDNSEESDRHVLVLPIRGDGSTLSVKVIAELCKHPEKMHSELSPREFEYLVGDVAERLGAEDIEITEYSGDGGLDVVARFWIDGKRVIVGYQCKRWAPHRKIQPKDVREAIGAMHVYRNDPERPHIAHADLCTTSDFTAGAKSLFVSRLEVSGMGPQTIAEILKGKGQSAAERYGKR